MAGLGGLGGGLGGGQRFLRGLHRGGERVEVADMAGFLVQLLLVGLHLGDFLVEPGEAVAVGANAALELGAPGGEFGQRRGQFAEHAFGRGQRRFRFGNPFIHAGALFDARLDLFL